MACVVDKQFSSARFILPQRTLCSLVRVCESVHRSSATRLVDHCCYGARSRAQPLAIICGLDSKRLTVPVSSSSLCSLVPRSLLQGSSPLLRQSPSQCPRAIALVAPVPQSSARQNRFHSSAPNRLPKLIQLTLSTFKLAKQLVKPTTQHHPLVDLRLGSITCYYLLPFSLLQLHIPVISRTRSGATCAEPTRSLAHRRARAT